MDTKNTVSDKIYFTYLDALRAIAFLGVFYAHTATIYTGSNPWVHVPLNIWRKFTVYGSYGVNFFFVLSGFLITFLLLRERDRSGTIDIRKFYRKRVLRIWPVYFMTLFFAAFILPYIISPDMYSVYTMTNPHMTLSEFWYTFFFSANFYQGLSIGMTPLSIGILWSVCIEEQFYLIWPWIVKWCNPRQLLLTTTSIISLSLLYKFLWAEDRMANYYLPWSLAMDLGFGALIGIGHYLKKTREMLLLACIIFGSTLLYAGVIIAANILPQIHLYKMSVDHMVLSDLLRLIKTIVLDLIFGTIIIFFINRNQDSQNKNVDDQQTHRVFRKIIVLKKSLASSLTHLGKISYGLYAYHTTALILMMQFLYITGFLSNEPGGTPSRLEFFGVIFGGFVLTIVLAELSYTFIERRFLALKDR